MRTSRTFWLLAFVVALVALLAVACGDDDDDGDEATATPGGGEPTATEPFDVANVPGVTETGIKLGTHQPLSNTPATAFAGIAIVTEAYFNFINATMGGVHGRQISLLREDDQFTPSITVEVVRRLVEQEEVFAILSGLGTATHLQVVDFLLERGVPDMYMSTGAIEWVRDPAARPNIFGAIPNYVAEGMVLAQYITQTYPGMKLGVIYENDEFGLGGLEGIERGVGSDIEIVGRESYEVADTDLNSQVDRLLAADADIIAIYGLPSHVPLAVRHARLDLDSDVLFVITGVSANELTIALSTPEALEGTVSTSIFRQAHETDHPGVAGHIQLLNDFLDEAPAGYLSIYGQYIAELMVETLERAGPELTREGLIAAAETITDFRCSVCLFDVNLSPTDHDPAQSLVLARVVDGKWVNFGDLISWEGVLPGDLTVDDLVTSPVE